MSDEAIDPQIVDEASPISEETSPETAVETVTPEIEGAAGEPATPDDDDLSPEERTNQAWARLRTERKEARDREFEAAKEAAYLKGKLEAIQKPDRPQVPIPDPMAPFNIPRPVEETFESFGEYEAAKDEWLVSRAKHEAKIEATREMLLTRASADTDTWMRQSPANLTDFDAVVRRPVEAGGPPLSVEMVEICRTSPVGHQLLYQLASDPREVARLRGMPPHLMAIEIGRREAKLSVAPAPPKKISDAPGPIQPITPAATNITKSLEELSEGDYIARRNREEFGPNWKGQ